LVVVFPEGMSEQDRYRVSVVSEDDMHSHERDRFPSKWFVVNAFGEGVFFCVRNRSYAQKLSDMIYGRGHYTVRQLEKAYVGRP
jgi:hypothetical protein